MRIFAGSSRRTAPPVGASGRVVLSQYQFVAVFRQCLVALGYCASENSSHSLPIESSTEAARWGNDSTHRLLGVGPLSFVCPASFGGGLSGRFTIGKFLVQWDIVGYVFLFSRLPALLNVDRGPFVHPLGSFTSGRLAEWPPAGLA